MNTIQPDNFVSVEDLTRSKRRRAVPPWLKKRIPSAYDTRTLKMLASLELNTVCQSAMCPNLPECYSRRVATFMILGNVCTRRCPYCAIESGRPEPIDTGEPERLAEAAARLKLRHVVVTSVNRDDLPDGGSNHFVRVIEALRARLPDAIVEVLTPDFKGDLSAVENVLRAGPDVFNHNIETVPRLFPTVRLGGNYARSIEVLRHAGNFAPHAAIKSGLMVGFGETPEEVRSVLRDLRDAGVTIGTVGQYIQPTGDHLEVVEYVHPDRFDAYREYALSIGYESFASGPFVRSSYQAEQVYGESSRLPRTLNVKL